MTHTGGNHVTCLLHAHIDSWNLYLGMIRSRTSDINTLELAQPEQLTLITMYLHILELQPMLASRGRSNILRLRKDMNSLIRIFLKVDNRTWLGVFRCSFLGANFVLALITVLLLTHPQIESCLSLSYHCSLAESRGQVRVKFRRVQI